MKKTFLFSLMFVFGQTLFAQLSLDSLWQKHVIDNYKKFDNYTIEAITTSTIRGKWNGKEYVDTVYHEKDTVFAYTEWEDKKPHFAGAKCNFDKGMIYFAHKDTATTISLWYKFIAIDETGVFYNGNISFASHFFASIVNNKSHFKKIDKISAIENYFVFECVDTSKMLNDIQMYEDVKMYVNKETGLLEKITTQRQNNTLAELGLGAIAREISINYLEINQKNSLYKELFFNVAAYPDFRVIKNESPYKKRLEEVEKEKAAFEKSTITLNKKILNCEIVDFENNTIKLNDVEGWLLLDLWYKSCFPCLEMMKEVAIHQEEFIKRNIQVVSLNTFETPSDYLKAFCEKHKINISDLYFFKNSNDIETFKKQLKVFPACFLISPDKQVVYQTNGRKTIDELMQEIDKAIKNYKTKKR